MGVSAALIVSYLLLWVIVLCLSVTVIAILRHFGVLYEAVNPLLRFTTASTLRLNEPLPALPLVAPRGDAIELRRFRNFALFILLVQLGCPACDDALEELREAIGTASVAPAWRIVVVVLGDMSAAAKLQDQMRLDSDVFILATPSRGARQTWSITSTPSALIVDAGGRVQRRILGVTSEQVYTILKAGPAEHVDSIALGRAIGSAIATPSNGRMK